MLTFDPALCISCRSASEDSNNPSHCWPVPIDPLEHGLWWCISVDSQSPGESVCLSLWVFVGCCQIVTAKQLQFSYSFFSKNKRKNITSFNTVVTWHTHEKTWIYGRPNVWCVVSVKSIMCWFPPRLAPCSAKEDFWTLTNDLLNVQIAPGVLCSECTPRWLLEHGSHGQRGMCGLEVNMVNDTYC